MAKHPVLQYENLDDRRTIHQLLERISPAKRIRFLEWACQNCIPPEGKLRPHVAARTQGTALEIYYDLFALSMQYGLDLDKTLARLVVVVRRQTGHVKRFMN